MNKSNALPEESEQSKALLAKVKALRAARPVDEETEHDRIREAYLRMANEAKYRPGAPSDGLGNIQLSKKELADPQRLELEADAYATKFIKEENTRSFWIGVSSFPTNRAFAYVIEAARQLCTGDGDKCAAALLEIALEDVKTAQHDGRDLALKSRHA